MENVLELYKVERALPDGQLVRVGTFTDVQEARKIVEGLSEYWPGDYRILQADSPDAGAGLQNRRLRST